MTEQEMRELDAWIAEHAFGWSHFTITQMGYLIGLNPESGLPCDVPRFTRDDFIPVKREIERRGWDWGVGYHHSRPRENRYDFMIYKDDKRLGHKYASSEEIAGCLAFKAAVKATEVRAIALGDMHVVTVELDGEGDYVVGSVIKGRKR